MEFLADLHVHSRFSRATSKNLSLERLHASALHKGLAVVGTGDFTHPEWFEEIRSKLEPAEEGLFRLRQELAAQAQREVPPSCEGRVRFILSAEISSIYKKGEQVRKVHNLIFVPTLEAARRFAARLAKIGNIASDGRPILGLDSKDLLALVLETSPEAFLVPAHVWTPWFSILGSKSGFDSVEECFEDLAAEVFALETGLSADPAMCGRLTALDRYSLISNSDAHSADKLGREANVFACDVSYPSIRGALRTGKGRSFLGTIEFFPEQGKYHLDGHRKCGCRMEPAETRARRGLCRGCGKAVTVGVMHRVEALADRPEGERPNGALPYDRLVSLSEVLGEAGGCGPQSGMVQKVCRALVARLGPELAILRRLPLDEIERAADPLVAEGIRRMRQGEVALEAGYDGEFGTVRIFRPGEREMISGHVFFEGLPAAEACGSKRSGEQKGTKGPPGGEGAQACPAGPPPEDGGPEPRAAGKRAAAADANWGPLFSSRRLSVWSEELLASLNADQQEAVLSTGSRLLVVAGPGTGKTMTLTCKIAYLVREIGLPPERILAVTFTLKAAREMEERLASLLGPSDDRAKVRVRTFHALGAELLREAGSLAGVPEDFTILDPQDQAALVCRAPLRLSRREADLLLERISVEKRNLRYPEEGQEKFHDPLFFRAFLQYQEALERVRALDFDDLVSRTVRAMVACPAFRDRACGLFRAVCADEYQDVNFAQHLFLRLLADSAQELFMIGDPDQAIYGFRGASPEYFRRFESDWPEGRVVRLAQNYRSTEAILSSACRVLPEGPAGARDRAALSALVRGGPPVRVAELATERSEAIFVARTIDRLMGGTDSLSLYADRVSRDERVTCRSFGEIAVLFRLSAQARELEEALRHQGIPFQSTTRIDLWQTAEGRALTAILQWLRGPDDLLAGERLRTALGERCREAMESLSRHCGAGPLPGETLEERVRGMRSLGVLPQEGGSWPEVWEMLLGLASREAAVDWDALLRSVRLSREPDALEARSEKVTLATLHASKGLEFPVVFLVGCETDLLPCRIGKEPSDPAEERRLLYVGMTRARRLLYICHARSRLLFGERRPASPSPFLADLPKRWVERLRPGEDEKKKEATRDLQPSLFKLP
ncbi:MAG: UvrD-helicase domain-containing protein [bacterium]